VILGLYCRSVGFCRAASELQSVVHQQSLTSAERSVIELYVDMKLVPALKEPSRRFDQYAFESNDRITLRDEREVSGLHDVARSGHTSELGGVERLH
jgi:hypothetical protein